MAGTINLTIEEAMAAVYEQFGYPPIDREGGEFTVQEYADRPGIPYNTASSQLKHAVKAGVLSERRVISSGTNCNAYKIMVK